MICQYCKAEYETDYEGPRSGSRTRDQIDTTGFSASQKKAFEKAKSYLKAEDMSRYALVDQLKSDGFTMMDALYVVDHMKMDWYEQAYYAARGHLSMDKNMSLSKLVQQLRYEKFTGEQADYGAQQAYSEIYGTRV